MSASLGATAPTRSQCRASRYLCCRRSLWQGRRHDPNPADGATGVITNTSLNWTAGTNASAHWVYFGANSNAVANATTNSPEFKGMFGSTSYSPGNWHPAGASTGGWMRWRDRTPHPGQSGHLNRSGSERRITLGGKPRQQWHFCDRLPKPTRRDLLCAVDREPKHACVADRGRPLARHWVRDLDYRSQCSASGAALLSDGNTTALSVGHLLQPGIQTRQIKGG